MPIKTILVLLATLASFGVFGYRFFLRFQHMLLGQPEPRFGNWWDRIKALIVYVAAQKRLFRFTLPGFAHFFIFWGFLLLLPTIAQAILEGLFPGFVLPILGTFGPFLLLQDLTAVLVAVAVIYGLYLRLIVNPERYQGSHKNEGVLVLCFILTIMLSLLFMNGIRFNMKGEANLWQPISSFAGRLLAGLPLTTQEVFFEVFYWIHLSVVLVFLPLLPGGKHFHVVTAVFNVFLADLEPRGKLPPAPSFEGIAGVKNVEQFTWREMLHWYTCTECGRCQDVCPAYNAGQELSPKLLIMGLRDHLFERGVALKSHTRTREIETILAKELTGEVILDETLWACTTCFACDQECPLLIEHIAPIVDMRRYLLTQQRADNQLMTALMNFRRYGNSFGKSDRQRASWIKGLDYKVKDIRKQPAHTLWFVGDYASYNPALTDITIATANVFNKAGIDFGLLYDGERNSGNDVRRIGEEGLFELLAMKNQAVMGKCEYEEIVTTDPHTYNTLKNEYTLNGKEKPIYHYTEILERAINEGRLPIKKKLDYTVTYHDPCFLGRYNNIYDAPRNVLKAIGCNVVEMPRNRDRALCCGAGGGRIWMEEEGIEERPSESRIQEALALNSVEFFVVTCPKDMTMYRDAVKTLGQESRLQVKDIIELVAEATLDEVPEMIA